MRLTGGEKADIATGGGVAGWAGSGAHAAVATHPSGGLSLNSSWRHHTSDQYSPRTLAIRKEETRVFICS